MSDSAKRDEWDKHNRDEAKERAAQQDAAGPGYRPVPTEPYENVSRSPEAQDADVDVTALIDEYERATTAEHVAWLGARDLIAGGPGSAPWNAWRDAVERTQRAVRSLVNCANASPR